MIRFVVRASAPGNHQGGTMSLDHFPTHTHQHLKFYIYTYRDPRDGSLFYVGKGKGNRAFSHLSDISERRKTIRIKDIRQAGHEPIIEILIHGLDDEEAAFQVEAAVIDIFGTDVLTNDVRGRSTRDYGVMSLEQIISKYDAPKATITDPVCLIRVSRKFRYGMSEQDLYDNTRGIWRIAPTKRSPQYAFAVYNQVIQEVYKIAGWFPAGSTHYSNRPEMAERLLGPDAERYEFVGSIAEQAIRTRYRFKNVGSYLARNSQSPVLYVNC